MAYATPLRTRGNGQTYWKEQQGWVQTPPYDDPLPYDCRVTTAQYGASFSNVLPADAINVEATNMAYSRLVDSSHEQTQWVVNFLEREQMISQIATTAGTLLKAFRLVKRGQVSLAAEQLAVPLASGKYRHSKNVANAWLSLHFGWAPLMQDIHSALEILDKPPRELKIRGSGRYSPPRWGQLDGYGSGIYNYGIFSCRMGANQVVTNAAHAQMSALGLVNPAAVAWELVPYSFVVDWFGNVGQVLESYTDFVGLELERPWTTHHLKLTREYWSNYKRLNVRTDVLTKRVLGVTKPRLHFSAKWPSATRAATAISLLVQHLRG